MRVSVPVSVVLPEELKVASELRALGLVTTTDPVFKVKIPAKLLLPDNVNVPVPNFWIPPLLLPVIGPVM